MLANGALVKPGEGGGSHPSVDKQITETQTINNTTCNRCRGAPPRENMMSASESPREARRRNLLSTRNQIRFRTWNVRTMYEGGRSANVAKEAKSYNLQVLGLCKTRSTNSGETRLSTRKTLIYAGHEEADAPHTEGVGIMISKEAAQALIG